MKGSVVTITPKMATKMLERNASFQRKVRNSQVRTLVHAIQRGEWQLTHQGIAFDVDGKLIDGQHRLLAIIAAGVPVEVFVITEAATESFIVLDTGKTRDTADLLAIETKEANIVSFFGRMAQVGSNPVSPAQKESLYDTLEEEIKAVVGATSGKRNIFHNTAFQAGAALAIHLRPEQKPYILNLLSEMTRIKIEDLPKLPAVARTAINKCVIRDDIRKSTGGEFREVLFGLGLYVMDIANKDSKRVPMESAASLGNLQQARSVLRTFI